MPLIISSAIVSSTSLNNKILLFIYLLISFFKLKGKSNPNSIDNEKKATSAKPQLIKNNVSNKTKKPLYDIACL